MGSIVSSQSKLESPRKSLARSVVLSENGLKSLASKQQVLERNPYFPQIYSDEKEIFQPGNKMSGNRYWYGEATQSINLRKG